MSRVPIFSDGSACYSDPRTNWDTWYIPQGIGADLIATMEGFDRTTVDAYAVESQARAAAHGTAAGSSARSYRSATSSVNPC